jgi:hypothetical protein
MATVTWQSFYPLILPDVANCPTVTVDATLAAVAADFCSRTQLWREELDPIYTINNIAEYDLDGTAVVESVLWVVCDGVKLTPTDARIIPHERLGEVNQPSHYWVVNENILRLFPIPNARYLTKVGVSLKPSRTAVGVEDWIYETWAETIASGAIARLARVPKKEWTDFTLSEIHRKLYERGIAEAEQRDVRNINMTVRQRPIA